MATNIPPHNLSEVIDAAVEVLDNPNAELADLMEHVKGPDFPTKGIIMGRSGIRAAYATGRGKVILRARTEFEEFGKDRIRIIITELPYQVNKKQLIKNIAEQVKDKRLDGISDMRDETDRNGMRIVIELKKDANPQVVLNKLFKQTALQSNFSIIMLALVNDQKQPRILSLRHILDEYLTFQEEVIVRRTRFDLRKAQERAHLLEGLLIAQDNIDEVIRIIRSSYDDAKQNLMNRFGLDDVQAQAICDMRLIALQGLNREKLEAEYKELEEKIDYFKGLLADPEKIKAVLKDELIEIRNRFGDVRQTEIQEVEDEIDIEDLIEEEDCCFTLSQQGYIKRMPAAGYRAQKRGGRGVNAQNLKEEDYVKSLFIASTHDYLLFFTNMGRVHRRKGYRIPEAGRTARGTAIVNVLPLEPGERVTAMVPTREFDEEHFLMMVTRRGTVKRLSLESIHTHRKAGIRALTLEEGDELISVLKTCGEDLLMICTRQGMVLCCAETDVRLMGRDALGVRGIQLEGDDCVIGAELYEEGKQLLAVTEKGFGKRTPVEEFLRMGDNGARGPQKRGGKGLKGYLLTEKTGPVAGVRVVSDEDDVMLIEEGGVVIRMAASDINVYRRGTQGVIVMRIGDGSRVIAIERVDKEESETAGEESNESEESEQ